MDILVVDDEQSIRDATITALEVEGHYAEPAANIKSAEMRLKEVEYDLVFLDLRLGDEDGLTLLESLQKSHPRLPVVIFTAYASVDTAIKATQLGAFDYLEKPFTPDQIRAILAKVRKQINTQKEIVTLETKVNDLKTQVIANSPEPRFESEDPIMQKELSTLFRAAPTSASILILGESGTGKSVVARAVHDRSSVADKPFVTVSCPSLSKELLESELFGHVKGAFTGAVKDAWGKVHAANGGTLFLDEIGELPMEIQPKLLRLLQEREYERLGENKTRSANVRVIAATNKNLMQSVEDGEFREDLFYRLNVISVEMPPLRSRLKDLECFANSYVDYFAKQIGRPLSGFSKKGLEALKAHPWPGNLRELRNSVERAVILCADKLIEPADLPSPADASLTSPKHDAILGSDLTLEELEAEHIKRVIERTNSLQKAAEILGIDKTTLYRKRKRYDNLD
ncbi:sigma-54-dependent Fis family transcriptional regulator [Verrucomicrobiaceae bacterium R5-34]|uniref:Sigma-54-dependent Fis family transcriptional regulator n=1 Tax=Oceaniferula flava TaxID=2800421 RepID=A0AAE2VCF3_9BACT|nr:sigma-54-dependent Fis family transcriptional regulator [Verrucomicrobiaceae bacterium R5-34]MBK1853364.1 sigma-54-dependent Fis family transcriptional regulator [Oceaniferula flavus]MBM1134669.1 sigma-54-dependent Fis family transcriptional regulator [Oceaniferula flavus]